MTVTLPAILRAVHRTRSLREAARELGVHHTTIADHLQRAGLPVPTKKESCRAVRTIRVSLSQSALELLDGLVIGDGSIQPSSGSNSNYSAQFAIQTPMKGFAESVYLALRNVGIPATMKPYIAKSDGYMTWRTTSCTSPDMYAQRLRWYPNGQRAIPNDVIETPTMWLWLYVSNGSVGIVSKRKQTFSIRLHTMAFGESDHKRLIKFLAQRGIDARFHGDIRAKKHHIYIGVHSSHRFLTLIGPPPFPEIAYKWPDFTP